MAPYLLAVVWQYFSSFPNKPLAWSLAVVASAIAWVIYNLIDEPVEGHLSYQFWIVTSVPLLFFFLIRLPFPDTSFDVLNYHILHGERALRGPLLMPGDFFPTPAPFNPTPDILTGLYRHALGYRAGTIVNLIALLWTAMIVDRFLRERVASSWVRAAAVFLVLATEQVLFQINNYMVDLLALPLLLEATLLALKTSKGDLIGRRLIKLAWLLGFAVAFKLANLIYAVPISIIYLINIDIAGPARAASLRRLIKFAPPAIIVFLLPVLPFTVFIYRLTGNPVFPLYNGIFKSTYWPQGVAFDPRWGPQGFAETALWPALMPFRSSRVSEYAFYSGRLSLGFIVAAVLIFIYRRDRQIGQIAVITLAGLVLWSASSGYIRYALYLELTSGILLVWLAISAWTRFLRGQSPISFGFAVLALLLFLPTPLGLIRAYKWEWSARENIFQRDWQTDAEEARQILRDRNLSAYLAPADQKLFEDVGLWIDTTIKTSGIAGLLAPRIPALGVRVPEYFVTSAARKRFAELLRAQQTKHMFTLTDRANLESARNSLAARGLIMGASHPVSIYYYSHTLKFDLLLVEVLPLVESGRNPDKGVALPDIAFNAKLSARDLPQTMRAGAKYDLHVMLTNDSEVAWPGKQSTWKFQLTVGNRWLKQTGEKVSDLDGRAPLGDDLAAGATTELPLTVTAPSEPGIYILQLDAIQEGVAWFGERGSDVFSVTIKVE